MTTPPSGTPVLYQSSLLAAHADRLLHGFSGKPQSYGGPDTPRNPRQTVLDNRAALLRGWGHADPVEWFIPEQVHGHRVGRTGDFAAYQTDAVLLIFPDQPVMLMFADCVPVILYDPVTHVGAVVHAGWRGTAQTIVQETVLAMQNVGGSDAANILAVMGPCIHACCYQVSREVAEQLGQGMALTVDQLTEKKVLLWDAASPQNPRLDLPGANRRQLEAMGVMQVEVMPDCTKCHPEKYWSYRRAEDGRNCTVMMLKPVVETP